LFLVGFFCSLFWFFCVLGPWCCGFFGLALVVPVYLGAPYAFFNKVLLTYIKKKGSGEPLRPMGCSKPKAKAAYKQKSKLGLGAG
jgi:hypothetical protein